MERNICETAVIGGIEVSKGVAVVVDGLKGEFLFQYVWLADGSFAVWDEKRHRMRSFDPARVRISRKRKYQTRPR